MNIEKIVRELIDKSLHMSLATVVGNKPWVCEVHFAYDESLNLYWLSRRDRRHSIEIAKNPNIAGNVVEHFELGQPCTGAVYFEGKAKLLEHGSSEQIRAFESMKKRLGTKEQDLTDTADDTMHQFYKASIDSWAVFGSFNGQPAQKYKLQWNKNKELK